MSGSRDVIEDLSELPADLLEELEFNGIDTDDLAPNELGGVRDGIQREDMPRLVDALLDLVDGPVEISLKPGDRTREYRVEWHRVEPDDWGSWGEFGTALEQREASR